MDAITHLQNLIRLDTSNPPGNEVIAAKYLADVLRRAGYEPQIIESAPGRGNVITRYRGDGTLAPLLLFNHLDVVPVEREHWTRDPFGGELVDGMIWGRGTLDMKNVVTQQLMVMLRLAAEKPRLRRDVIFAGCADEEVSGRMGLGYLIREYPDLIKAEIGFSESGAIPLFVDQHTLYPIQCGEKGVRRLQMRTQAAPGHGASPNYQQYAIRQMAIALERLTRQYLPVHLTPTVNKLLVTLAPLLDLAIDPGTLTAAGLEQILPRITSPPLRNTLFHITRNSAAPTMLSAGNKANVVPSLAEAILDGRILPGQTTESLMAEVNAVIGNGLSLEITPLPQYNSPALETTPEGPAWEAIERNLKRHDPKAVVIPLLLAGSTDAAHLAPLGIKTFGFSPMKMPRGFEWRGLIHGHDERIPVTALPWGIKVLYDTVIDLCR